MIDSPEMRRAMRMQKQFTDPVDMATLRTVGLNETVVSVGYIEDLNKQLEELRARLLDIPTIDVNEISTNKEIIDEPTTVVDNEAPIQPTTQTDNQAEPGTGDETQPTP